jgi:hypothetical protein
MEFPDWVKGPTACKTRTFSMVLPSDTQHRARKIVASVENRPTEIVRRIKTTPYMGRQLGTIGELSTAWVGSTDPYWEVAPKPIEDQEN